MQLLFQTYLALMVWTLDNDSERTGVMKRASWILTVLLGMTGANEARAQFFFSNTVAVGPSVRSRSFVRIGPYRSFGGVFFPWAFPSFFFPSPYLGVPYWWPSPFDSNPALGIYPPQPPAPLRPPQS